MKDEDKITRLEETLGTLISWLQLTLGERDTVLLLRMLQKEDDEKA